MPSPLLHRLIKLARERFAARSTAPHEPEDCPTGGPLPNDLRAATALVKRELSTDERLDFTVAYREGRCARCAGKPSPLKPPGLVRCGNCGQDGWVYYAEPRRPMCGRCGKPIHTKGLTGVRRRSTDVGGGPK